MVADEVELDDDNFSAARQLDALTRLPMPLWPARNAKARGAVIDDPAGARLKRDHGPIRRAGMAER